VYPSPVRLGVVWAVLLVEVWDQEVPEEQRLACKVQSAEWEDHLSRVWLHRLV